MAMHGFPGKMRVAKNTLLMAPSSIGTAMRTRRSTYWTMVQAVLGGLVQDLEHLRIVVAVVQRELPVLRIEGRADALGIARPLPRDIADRQTDQVALDALLGLGIDAGPLLHVALEPSCDEQVVNALVMREVGALVAGRR